ncbi:MAG: hypothetical protein QNJ04_09760 [Desulfobacterales bacterium]|nr:hypothetical protein [Desulfobacterales bacterium]
MPGHYRKGLLILVVIMGLALPVWAGNGRITARVSLTDHGGQVVYGDWVRVYLVTEPVDVPELDLAGAEAVVERTARINTAHLDFFIGFQARLDQDGYLVDNKLTRPDGAVAFNQLPPGPYYLVVTFPTMIAGQKATWQVPIEAVAERTVHIELNAANMALRLPPQP